ncbi:radical SAM protein [Desulfonema magnum]|nr:radical SAM protein [Desulfonema magnum]
MTHAPPHRNITLKRLSLDFYQFIRAQSFMVERFGRQFAPSREFVEIDITYKCNLKCINCNRSCTQAPGNTEMPVSTIEAFIRQSIEQRRQWKRIRILGGEPTLHSRIFDIIDLLSAYQSVHNPGLRLVLCTNYFGRKVRDVVDKLPDNIIIKTTLKTSRVNLFRPFNVAPADTRINRFSDYSCGCRIITDCGLGLTPSGYYMCAIAGGIDRIFQYHLGRETLPDRSDAMTDQMSAFCGLCGHFGFQWPVKKEKMSSSWQNAYLSFREQARESAPCVDNQ